MYYRETGNVCNYHSFMKTCCGYSLEAPCQGTSNEYLQNMFSWRNKKKKQYVDTHIWNCGFRSDCVDAESNLRHLFGEHIRRRLSHVNVMISTGIGLSNRWNFIQANTNVKSEKKRTRSVGIYRRSLQKRLLHHKQKLKDLEQAKKVFMSQEKEGQVNHTMYKHQEKQFQKELSKYASKVRK